MGGVQGVCRYFDFPNLRVAERPPHIKSPILWVSQERAIGLQVSVLSINSCRSWYKGPVPIPNDCGAKDWELGRCLSMGDRLLCTIPTLQITEPGSNADFDSIPSRRRKILQLTDQCERLLIIMGMMIVCEASEPSNSGHTLMPLVENVGRKDT